MPVNTNEPATPEGRQRPARSTPLPSTFGRVWRFARSLKVAVVLMGLIALSCIVGTLIKQEPYDPVKITRAYGRRLGSLIGLLGLNQLYHAPWFVGLLGLFALSTIACALSRLRLTARSIGFGAIHLSVLFLLTGAILKGVAGVEGIVELKEGQRVEKFRTDSGELPLGFRLRLDDFVVRRYEGSTGSDFLEVRFDDQPRPATYPIEVGKKLTLGGGKTTIEVLRMLPHFVKGRNRIYSASSRPVNPAVQVRVVSAAGATTRWLFSRFPGFRGHGGGNDGPDLRYIHRPAPIKSFESHLAVLDDQGRVVKRATVLVNRPLKVGRYTLYQLSYDPETEAASTLQVVRDPGVGFVYAGFVLMPLGMVFVFYVRPLLRGKGSRNV